MRSYLHRLAQVFAQEVGKELSEYTFVFPNRRAGLFFRKFLGQSLSQPIFSPKMMTINECFASLTDLRVTDQLSLLLRLYTLYQEQRPNAESIDKFLHWGKMMLADFSEVDNHLVDNVKSLFAAVKDMREIDMHFDSLTENQLDAIRQFWGEFNQSAHKSDDHNIRENFLTTWELLYPLYIGLQENLLQDKLAYEGLLHRQVIEHWQDIPADKFDKHYVFVGFNALTASERRLLQLMRDRGCADFYFDYEDAKLADAANRASLFMKDNLREFASRYQIPRRDSSSQPDITLLSVSSTIGEAREVHHILDQLYPAGTASSVDFTRTAVVLPDEHLLIPLLDCFPQSVQKINVTMGYPLRASNLFIPIAYPEQVADPMPSDGLSMINLLDEYLNAHHSQENSEAHYLILKSLTQIEEAIQQYTHIKFSAEAVVQILRMLTMESTIPYVGEPLDGLQVMGVLETRALDFDNLIITGFNDDLYPGKSHSNSFIPYVLRRGFGLPTPERQDAIFAYNFYRMLSYAERVWLITNSTADEQHSGEPSRYLYQMQWQYGMPIHHIEVAMPLSAPEAYEISITKDERVLDTLHQWRQKKISASAINKYLSCQKQFYYRYVLGIHEPPPEEDISISAITLGNVFHHAMETLYGEYINKIVTESTIETIEQSLTEERFEQLLAEISIDIVATNVVKQYILNTLAYDKTLTPFIYLGSEQFVHHSLDIPGIGSIAFGGYIDRVDIIQDRLRLIDYKTGSPKDLHYTSMEKVFQQNQHNEKALQTLLYCWMMSHSSFPFLQRAQQIEPHLYYLRNMSDPSQVSTQVCKIKKEDFCFTPEVEQEFTEFLTKLIQEIFNPEVRIEPTTEQKTTCEYCAYSELCKR